MIGFLLIRPANCKTAVSYFKALFAAFFWNDWRQPRKASHYSWFPRRDSNPWPYEIRSSMLTTRPRYPLGVTKSPMSYDSGPSWPVFCRDRSRSARELCSPGLWPHVSSGHRRLPLGVKWLEREVDCSPLSNAELNTWSFASSPPYTTWCSNTGASLLLP
jgi:hypothetical protein